MKKLALTLAALAVTAASAQVWVNPYVTKNGTYVPGYVRTAPDNTLLNNYSTQGNINPYTGQAGTVNPYSVPSYTPPTPYYYSPPVYRAPVCGLTRTGQFVCL